MKELNVKDLSIPKDNQIVDYYTDVMMLTKKSLLKILTENFVPVNIKYNKRNSWEENRKPKYFLIDECDDYDGWFYEGSSNEPLGGPEIVTRTYFISNEEVATIFMMKFG